MMYLYFYLISFSLIGYGYFAKKLLKIDTNCFGILGLLGITLLAIISYSSTLFISHGYLFNSIIHLGGIIFFSFLLKILIIYQMKLKFILFFFLYC